MFTINKIPPSLYPLLEINKGFERNHEDTEIFLLIPFYFSTFLLTNSLVLSSKGFETSGEGCDNLRQR